MKQLVFLLALLPVVACTSQASGTREQAATAPEDFQADTRPLGRTLVYECLGYEFLARVGPGEMAVWLQDEYRVLSQVRSASGVKYEEGDVQFWSKGEEAFIRVAGQRYPDCQLAPERAR